ncbi:VTT domain-containing protein [uncultured Limosilactobacillus sp.]|uniref:TVP38/TMEM64 family protein n=1 Tax=uncultured Limosilactobacillus sp. TaxID=2837629 RepID=UPI0025FC7EB4|nr:VTT domain-containing protein [uncultured Limosilactobacillus sp.]
MTKRKTSGIFLIIIGVIIVLAGITFIYHDFKPELQLLMHLNSHNKAKLMVMMRSHGLPDMLLLVVLVAVLNSIPGLSNSVICLFAGICFGPWLGLTINWSGNILGNLVVYSLLSKLTLPAKWTHNKLLTELNHSAHKKLRLIISFMVPIIPSIIVNYACAQEKMDLKQFLPLVIIGMLPTSFLYAFGGDAIFRGNIKRIVVAVVLIIAVVCCYRIIMRNNKNTVRN